MRVLPAQRMLLARRLESSLDKQRILALYLNVCEWGDGVYGAEAAAQEYFNVHASELTLAQAAILAAVNQNVTYAWLLGHHEGAGNLDLAVQDVIDDGAIPPRLARNRVLGPESVDDAVHAANIRAAARVPMTKFSHMHQPGDVLSTVRKVGDQAIRRAAGCAGVMFGLAPEAAFTPTLAAPRVEHWRQLGSISTELLQNATLCLKRKHAVPPQAASVTRPGLLGSIGRKR